MPSLKSYVLTTTIVALLGGAAATFFVWNSQGLAGSQHGHEAIAEPVVSGHSLHTVDHANVSFLNGMQAVFYKSPMCGCCDIYIEELEAAGVQVAVVSDAQRMYEVKQHYRIPPAGVSCHTFTLGEYVIEGHVPFEALAKLLTERPEVDGIVLGGMPIGTPGMPGEQTAPF